MAQCFICKTEVINIASSDYDNQHKIDCPQCGKYQLSGYSLSDQDFSNWNKEKRNLVSHYIRQSGKKNDYPIWDHRRIQYTVENRKLPKPAEQINYLVQYIGNKSQYFGEMIEADNASITGFTGCLDKDAVYHLLTELNNKGLVKFHGMLGSQSAGLVMLLLEGWNYYDKISKSSESSDNAFMAMQFGDPNLNHFFEEKLKPAVLQTGYSLFKLEDRPKAGLIDIRLRQEIKNSKFIIADLTHQNAGAYWEAGFAEGIGKEVIYTCEKSIFEDQDKKPHFDVNHHLTIIWDKDSPEEAVKNLKAAIRFTFPEARQVD